MAPLNLPIQGVVYVDTPILIYTVERHPVYWTVLHSLWDGSRRGDFQVVSSELAFMEVLVLPLKNNDSALVSAYEQALLRTEMGLLPITLSVLKQAARLRAIHNLRTPDAIHAATAIDTGCVAFITNDRASKQVPDLPAQVLDELLV